MEIKEGNAIQLGDKEYVVKSTIYKDFKQGDLIVYTGIGYHNIYSFQGIVKDNYGRYFTLAKSEYTPNYRKREREHYLVLNTDLIMTAKYKIQNSLEQCNIQQERLKVIQEHFEKQQGIKIGG